MVKLKFQNRSVNSQGGFTFIEMLLVLTITMLISLIGITLGKSHMDRQLEDRFIKQLKADIELTQALSFRYQDYATLTIVQGLNEVRIKVPAHGNKDYLVRKYPTNIQLLPYSTIQSVTYTKELTVQKSGTMYFSINNRIVKLTVYLGEGRVQIEQ